MLSFAIEDKLHLKIKLLHEDMAVAWQAISSLEDDEKSALHQMARVSQIGASTRIENAVLTDAEVDWVDTLLSSNPRPTAFEEAFHRIENKLSKDKERSLEEVAGCRNMLLLIYEQGPELFPLTEITLRGLHQELLRFYPAARHYLGTYKTVTNSVVERNHRTNTERTVFRTAEPGPITGTAMADLIQWYNVTLRESPWTIAVASELVYRFLAIHPFQDGNGRISRGLFVLALLQSSDHTLAQLARYLPIDRHIERHRAEYYAVLQRCSGGIFHHDPREYRIDYFLEFMVRVLQGALKDLRLHRKRYRTIHDLSPAALQVFDCFREHPEKRLQTKDLLELSGLPRRTVNYALKTLSSATLIRSQGQGAGTRYQMVF